MRTALARLAAAPEDAVQGAPGEPVFDSAPAPEVVLLGVTADFEAELEFAHRTQTRLPDTGFVLVAERRDLESARRLFDTLGGEPLAYPPEARQLRWRIREAGRRRALPLPLSQRPGREGLRERFTRWFADLELSELLRAVDPRLANVPILIRGEPGTGRGLLARYIRAFGAGGRGRSIACTAETTRPDLLTRIASSRDAGHGPRAVLLEDVDRLPQGLQRELRSWVEYGPPEGVPADRLRWIATAGDEGPGEVLDPDLRRALGGLLVRIPPLRERRRAIAALANETARSWCMSRGLTPRRMGEDAILVLEEYPWPGNLRELEAVVEQTLLAGAGDPVSAAELVLDGSAFAPLAGAGRSPAPAEGEREREPERERKLEPALPDGRAEPSQWTARAEPEVEAPEAPEEVAPEQEEKPRELPDASLRRLAGALAHEVRNPLTAIRSFAALLPDRYSDSDFRGRFAELVAEGVDRIEDVVGRLERLASLAPPMEADVDMEALLTELLRERRDAIRRRRLLVLKELDADQPLATGDADQLRFAFEALLNKALDLVPEEGDIYCASKHHATGLDGRPSLRVLLRYRSAEDGDASGRPLEGLSPAENALEFVIADAVIRAQGGRLAVNPGDAETVVVVDLPAPA